MSTVRRVAKNTSVLFIANFASYVLTFFASMYTARYLGANGLGILSTAIALSGIFAVFTDLGLSTLIIREVSRDKTLKDKYLGNTFIIRTIVAFLTFGLIVIFAHISNYPPETRNIIYIISIPIIITVFPGIFTSIFQAYELMEYQAISLILNSTLFFAGTIFLIFKGSGIQEFALLYIFTAIIILAYSLVMYIWKFSLPKIDIDLNLWKPMLKNALPLSFTLIFSAIAFKVDTVILSLLKNSVAVGYYTAPYALMQALLFIPAAFTAAIFPILSKFHVSSKSSVEITYEKSFKYLSMLGLPIAVGTTLLANPIILLIYKEGFTQSIIALKILIWTIPFIFMTFMFGTLLAAINKQNLTAKILFILMFFNIVLNLIFIPVFNYIGAAVVTVITEILGFIIEFYYISKLICKIKLHKYILKPAIASAIMGLFIYYTQMNLFITIMIATILYFGLLIILKTFSDEDYNLLKEIINIKR